jgi:hypothetical protein
MRIRRKPGVAAVTGLLALAIVAVGVTDEVIPKHEYIGVAKCARLCHRSSKQGKQLDIWEDSKHAHAYETLKSDEAKAVGKTVGVDEPHKSPKCLKCHATGWNVPDKYLGSRFDVEDGVQCETCHGPGDDYKGKSTMKDKEKAIANGLIIGDKETCLTCHNDESPSWDPERFTTKDGKKVGFDYELLWPRIAHPIPEDD